MGEMKQTQSTSGGRRPASPVQGRTRTRPLPGEARSAVQSGRLSEKRKSAGKESTALQEKREAAVPGFVREWDKNIVRTRGGVDRVMLALTLILLSLGSIMVFSASYPSALAQEGDSLYYIKRHLVFAAAGVVLMLVLSLFDSSFYEDMAPIAFAVATALLIFVLIPSPLSISRGAAHRWLDFRIFTLQPSELMKAALILMLARYLSRHQDDLADRSHLGRYLWRGTLCPCIFVGIACGLVILENHLSGTLIMGLIGVCVMLMGCVPPGWLALFAVGGGAAVAIPFLATQDYAWQRIETYLNKEEADVLDEAWQTTQGQYAIGSGGLLGTGLGGSRQKYSYVSEPQNDFIFTIWCEEMGFVGAIAVIVLYLLFIWRGIVIAMRAPDTFSALVVLGVVGHVGIQAFLNIGVVTGVLPNTGVSLPFFSYGGTSLLILMAEMGVVLAVSRRSYVRK